jgi:hypothetical protein
MYKQLLLLLFCESFLLCLFLEQSASLRGLCLLWQHPVLCDVAIVLLPAPHRPHCARSDGQWTALWLLLLWFRWVILIYLYLSNVFNFAGLFLYITKIPERFWPGAFDLLVCILVVVVVVAAAAAAAAVVVVVVFVVVVVVDDDNVDDDNVDDDVVVVVVIVIILF